MKQLPLWSPYQMWKPEALGLLELVFFGETVTFAGGPYRAKPDGMIGVKMASEIALPCDIDVPTDDYKIPDRDVFWAGMLAAATAALVRPEGVYVGCLMGRGRTGLMLATLARMSGLPNPVGYVRKHYYDHAVETQDQRQFVHSFGRWLFRYQLMRVLVDLGAVNCIPNMSWRDRLLWRWVCCVRAVGL